MQRYELLTILVDSGFCHCVPASAIKMGEISLFLFHEGMRKIKIPLSRAGNHMDLQFLVKLIKLILVFYNACVAAKTLNAHINLLTNFSFTDISCCFFGSNVARYVVIPSVAKHLNAMFFT